MMWSETVGMRSAQPASKVAIIDLYFNSDQLKFGFKHSPSVRRELKYEKIIIIKVG
jgi:hypothetical protein